MFMDDDSRRPSMPTVPPNRVIRDGDVRAPHSFTLGQLIVVLLALIVFSMGLATLVSREEIQAAPAIDPTAICLQRGGVPIIKYGDLIDCKFPYVLVQPSGVEK